MSNQKTQHLLTQGDARDLDFIPDEGVHLIVTSPPYGDSRTTVAYGQFSRLANQWLGNEDASQVDNILMGGVKKGENKKFESNTLNVTVNKIRQQDKNRSKDVISFFIDYEKSIRNISKTIKSGGYACFVVGNRSVRGITIPTDEITKDYLESNGFKHIETVIRNIPNKRMPSENSPTNITGKKASTMKNEFIVVCKKI